jgi:hypothetical protein
MEIADMRRLLNESKSSGKPIGCAVGMSKDMKTALLLLHKMHEGPEVGRNLKKDVPDIVNMRFGTARIDEEHTNMVRLVLNRPVTGIAKKLVKTLKGTGYTKVKLGLEDGTEFEGAEDEEEAQAGKTAPTAEAPASPAEAAAPPPPPPPPEKEDAPPDADALKKELAALAAQIPAAAAGDASKTAALVKLAREGQVNIATNNLKYAAISVEQLRRAIATAGVPGEKPAAAAAPPPPPPPPPAPPQGAKPDADALRKQLEALAKRIPEAAAGDAKRSAELVKMARDAQVNIATNNFTYAATSIEQLRVAIEGKATAPAEATPPVDTQKTLAFLQRLKLLILKAADGDTALEAQWMAMANAAEAQLSGGDASAGSAGVEALRIAMLPAVTRMQDEAKATGAYTSSGKKWLEMRQTVEDEMEKLRLTIAGAYQDDPALPAIEKAFRERTAPVLRTLNADLATKLEAAGKATKAEERQKLVDEAHGIIDGYKKYATDPLLADLDNNPFVALSLQASLTATLSELAGAIH